ncbi:MAG: helix-turn-helix domain-containing protein [Firmicutes bacterium]|nr:helix-turn-helix domain-containing protein [Bacillota bacterium]
MKIGANICEFRKAMNLTQEQLSNSFGVSVAAVSKWETGVAYPDIELLPKIAEFFKVSVDYLLGYDMAAELTIEAYIDTAMKLYFERKSKEAVEYLSGILARYPNNNKLKIAFARLQVYATHGRYDNERHKKLISDAEKILLSMPDNSLSRNEYEDAQYILSMTYTAKKQYDEELAIINRLKPSEQVNIANAEYMIHIKKGDLTTAEKLIKRCLHNSLMDIEGAVSWSTQIYYDTPEKVIEINNWLISLFKLVTNDMQSFLDGNISYAYENVAYAYSRLNSKEEALVNFEKAIEYALRDADAMPVTLPFTGKLVWNDKPELRPNAVKSLLAALNSGERDDYALIRDDMRFVDCVGKLENANINPVGV